MQVLPTGDLLLEWIVRMFMFKLFTPLFHTTCNVITFFISKINFIHWILQTFIHHIKSVVQILMLKLANAELQHVASYQHFNPTYYLFPTSLQQLENGVTRMHQDLQQGQSDPMLVHVHCHHKEQKGRNSYCDLQVVENLTVSYEKLMPYRGTWCVCVPVCMRP